MANLIKEIDNILSDCGVLVSEQKLSPKVFANAGDVAEGVLGATLVARFLYPEQEITGDLVFRIIQQLNQVKDRSQGATVIKQRKWSRPGNPEIKGSKADKILFKVGLSKNNFDGFTNYDFFQKISGIVDGAIKFASSAEIMSVVRQVYEDPNENQVEISSIGTEDQKGTKVDLNIIVDGEPINWGKLSLKAGGTKQVGQIGKGWAGDPSKKRFVRGIFDLFQNLFGIQLSSKLKNPYVEAIQSEDKQAVIDAIDAVYDNAYSKIASRFSGDEDELVEFLHTLANGLQYEAALEEQGVILVHLDRGDFAALDFNKLIDIIDNSDIDVTVEYRPPNEAGGMPYLFIEMAVDGKDFGHLISVRPKVRFSEKTGRMKEFRHYVQKEHGLVELLKQAGAG